MDKEDKTVTEAILDEIGRLGGVIESRREAAERFVAVAGSIAGIGLTLGLFQNQRVVLVGLPIAIALIFAYCVIAAASVWTLFLAVRENQNAEAKSRTIASEAYAIPAQD
jgi:hypothetical protein